MDANMKAVLLITTNRKNSGVSQLTIAAPEGPKIDLAKSLDAADTYIPLSRKDATPQWEQLKKDNPYGFDIGSYCRDLYNIVSFLLTTNNSCRGFR